MYASCVGLGEAGERQVRDNGGTSTGRTGVRAAGGHRGGEAEDGAYDLRVSHDARASAAHTPVVAMLVVSQCFAAALPYSLCYLSIQFDALCVFVLYSMNSKLSFVAPIQRACYSSYSFSSLFQIPFSALCVFCRNHLRTVPSESCNSNSYYCSLLHSGTLLYSSCAPPVHIEIRVFHLFSISFLNSLQLIFTLIVTLILTVYNYFLSWLKRFFIIYYFLSRACQ